MPVAQFGEDWHDERLMEALTRACQVIPRHPADAPSSAPSILERWRARVGVAVSAEAVQQSAAWEVRSHHATCSSCQSHAFGVGACHSGLWGPVWLHARRCPLSQQCRPCEPGARPETCQLVLCIETVWERSIRPNLRLPRYVVAQMKRRLTRPGRAADSLRPLLQR